MAISIGRLGYLGLGIESSNGSAAAASTYLPFTDISLRAHHEPLEVIGSKASRYMDKDSVVGKKWAEGDIEIDLDVTNSGYLWKMALGNEQVDVGTPNTHTFYVVASGNSPRTATLIYGRDTDVEQYTYAAVDELTLEVADSIAKLTGTVMAKFPTTGAAQTVTVTSGTVLSFKDMNVYFGNDLTTALAASATPVNELTLTIANNLEVIHRSGSADVSAIRTKGARVSGKYTVYFDSETDKNAYYNLNKRAMAIKFVGNENEDLTLRIPRFRLSEGEIATGIDDFFVVNCEFVAEDVLDTGTATRLFDVVLRNDKATAY